MTYTAGSTIVDSDYNGFANDTDDVWGVGTLDSGYGQTNTVGVVGVGGTVTATQWATLLTRIASAASHSGTTISAIANPTAGSTIAAYAALSTNISAIRTNNAAASGADTTVATTTTSAWTASATTTKTITFASYDQLRYFFNAGGMIRLGYTRSGGTASDQNTSWTNLLAQAGAIVLTGAGSPGAQKTIAGTLYYGTTRIGGTGTPTVLAEDIGVYNLNGTNQELYKQYATTYTYTSNYNQIQASISGAVITITTTLIDVDGTGGGYLDSINGTLTMNTTIRQPSTTYIANTWGTITQNAATWSLT
jgi:hypothetical protein